MIIKQYVIIKLQSKSLTMKLEQNQKSSILIRFLAFISVVVLLATSILIFNPIIVLVILIAITVLILVGCLYLLLIILNKILTILKIILRFIKQKTQQILRLLSFVKAKNIQTNEEYENQRSYSPQSGQNTNLELKKLKQLAEQNQRLMSLLKNTQDRNLSLEREKLNLKILLTEKFNIIEEYNLKQRQFNIKISQNQNKYNQLLKQYQIGLQQKKQLQQQFLKEQIHQRRPQLEQRQEQREKQIEHSQ